jgi:hypothetical protein
LHLGELMSKDLTRLSPIELEILWKSNRHNFNIICFLNAALRFPQQIQMTHK